LRNKTFSITAIVVTLLCVAVIFAFFPMGDTTDYLESATVFESIDELAFLQQYVCEEYEPKHPQNAVDGYKAELEYDGHTYDIEAYKFDSEESALRFIWGSDTYDAFHGKNLSHTTLYAEQFGELRITLSENGSYLHISGPYTRDTYEFISFVYENLSVPVDTEVLG